MRWLGILALLAALTACSDSGDAAPLPATTPTSTLVAAPATTPAPTTTVPTEDPEVAAVREAHLAFLEMFEVVGDPPNPDHPELARRATGDAYERLRSNLTQDQLTGHRYVGSVDSQVETIEVNGESALVVDCFLDGLTEVGPNGVTIIAGDSSRSRVTVHLVRSSSGWQVERFVTPVEPVPCGR